MVDVTLHHLCSLIISSLSVWRTLQYVQTKTAVLLHSTIYSFLLSDAFLVTGPRTWNHLLVDVT